MGASKQRSGASAPADEWASRGADVNGSDRLAQFEGLDAPDPLAQVAQSGLTGSMVQATLWTVAIMAVLTVGPYLMYSQEPATKAAAKPAGAAAPVPSEAAIDPTRSAMDVADKPSVDQQKAVKIMGLDDVKTADPATNPLEKKSDLDKLLDMP